MDPKTGLQKSVKTILLTKIRAAGICSFADAAHLVAALRASDSPLILNLEGSAASAEGMQALDALFRKHPIAAMALRGLTHIPERYATLWTKSFLRISQDRILTEPRA